MRSNEYLRQGLSKTKERETPKHQEKTVNTVDEEPHPEDSVNFLQSAKLYESNYSSGEDNTVALIENDIAKIELLNMPNKTSNISTTILVVSGSEFSILNRSLASQVVKSIPHAF